MHPWHSVLAFGSLFPKCMPLAFERTYPASWICPEAMYQKPAGPMDQDARSYHTGMLASLSLSLSLSFFR